MLNRQAAMLIQEQTLSLAAMTAVEEASTLQEARATSLREVASAQAAGLNHTTQALANGMGELANGLGWSGREALQWLWWDTGRRAALRYITPEPSGGSQT